MELIQLGKENIDDRKWQVQGLNPLPPEHKHGAETNGATQAVGSYPHTTQHASTLTVKANGESDVELTRDNHRCT